MERKEAKSIGEILAQFLKVTQLEDHSWEEQMAQVWRDTLGEMVANETHSIHLASGTLFVNLKSPSLKHEIMMQRTRIKELLNTKLSHEVIKTVVIR